MKKYYSSYQITNDGEQEVDNLINRELLYDKEKWVVFHSYRLAKHINKKQGECDYIFINKRGILVLEVKSGLIEFSSHKFFYASTPKYPIRKEIKESPFVQVDGNVGSIVRFLKSKNLGKVLVSGGVAFPQSTFNYKGLNFKNFYHVKSSYSFRDFLIKCYNESLKKSKLSHISLSDQLIDNIETILSPTIMPEEFVTQLKLGKEEVKRRAALNFQILDGLNENKRILVQGPPGSGKSKYAYKYVERKLNEIDSTKGIYLCWNELLAADVNYRLKQDGFIDRIKAWPLFRFAQELIKLCGNNAEELGFHNADEINQKLEQSITELKKLGKIAPYDFIVIDEGQDIFHKGIDVILDNLLHDGKNGLERGEYAVFYDRLQAYDMNITDTLEYLKFSAAHFRLFNSFRAIAGLGIDLFINDINSGTLDLNKMYGRDVRIEGYKDYSSITRAIKRIVKGRIKTGQFGYDDIIVLFTSNLLGEKKGVKRPMEKRMKEDQFFRLLTPENIEEKVEQVNYTTALKFKGLERNIVILVIDDLMNEKINTQYQLFIGATRARLKLFVILNEKDL